MYSLPVDDYPETGGASESMNTDVKQPTMSQEKKKQLDFPRNPGCLIGNS